MKFPTLLLVSVLLFSGCAWQKEDDPLSKERIDQIINQAAQQYKLMCQSLPDSSYFPRSAEDGQLTTCDYTWWTSGFFPGTLWYLYEATGDAYFREQAHRRSMATAPAQHITTSHDLGFMLYCGLGNGLRITDNQDYNPILLQGARSLASRYNDNVKSIESWDWGSWKNKFAVIVDNMMNLELLMWASKVSQDSILSQIAARHALTTMKNHYRDDYSCYHILVYDSINGDVLIRQNGQGYADESAWARGQAWGLYGYTMMYRETGDERFLNQAEKIAGFIINHVNWPSDHVPYWDFNDPKIPDTYRDASAGAVMASALIELSGYSGANAEKYLNRAEKILLSLANETYLAKPGDNHHFILKHSVGSLPGNSEVDVPLSYADYYFIEALMRYRKILPA